MTAAELREKTLAELQEELVRLRREQFNLRMQRASEQLPQTHLLRETRRDIARVNTVMHEKAQQASRQEPQEDKAAAAGQADAAAEAKPVATVTDELQEPHEPQEHEPQGPQDNAEEKTHA